MTDASLSSQLNALQDAVNSLSTNADSEGFDLHSGRTWIYPTNYSMREYQYNIVQEALYKNTLVSLPTGLGKTFIAAVVMYNFFRWYPTGKIIFMAPTKPLVKQQMNACYNIMAIPKDTTAELTGMKAKVIRKDIWKEKRVFFITPQTLNNDLNFLDELGHSIKCLVFDEAHKAKGRQAYCEVIRKLWSNGMRCFRVLALSATPGSSVNDVLQVITNLQIAHLELRTDESPDVTPYVSKRSLETVVVPLSDKLQEVREKYIKILERYTRVLVQHKVVLGNCSMLTKGKIFMTMKDYQERNRQTRSLMLNDLRDPHYNDIMRNLNICVTLYHAFDLLIRHGLRGFLSFFEEHAEKPLLKMNVDLQIIMKDVSQYLGPIPKVDPLPDGSIPKISDNSKFGHPKYYKLEQILIDHFTQMENESTRAIVFCEYRESVLEAYALLLRRAPLILPKTFMGQSGITQKQQIGVVASFRKGECNTLISTCIGEEGLDIGDVDLIVCFDISNKSPIRMVQRMGRTGRKRQGRVVVLVTEGREEQTLKECLINKETLSNRVLVSGNLQTALYKSNPRMIPEDLNPECQKLYMTIATQSQTKLKNKGSLKEIFDNMASSQSSKSLDQAIKPTKLTSKSKKGKTKTVSRHQSDIRTMFASTTSNVSDVRVINTEPSNSGETNSEKPSDSLLIQELHFEISNYLAICKDSSTTEMFHHLPQPNHSDTLNFNLDLWIKPTIDNIDAEAIESFGAVLLYSTADFVETQFDFDGVGNIEDDTLDFFLLNNLKEIFDQHQVPNNDKQETVLNSAKEQNDGRSSPVLTSYDRIQSLRSRAKAFYSQKPQTQDIAKPDLQVTDIVDMSVFGLDDVSFTEMLNRSSSIEESFGSEKKIPGLPSQLSITHILDNINCDSDTQTEKKTNQSLTISEVYDGKKQQQDKDTAINSTEGQIDPTSSKFNKSLLQTENELIFKPTDKFKLMQMNRSNSGTQSFESNESFTFSYSTNKNKSIATKTNLLRTTKRPASENNDSDDDFAQFGPPKAGGWIQTKKQPITDKKTTSKLDLVRSRPRKRARKKLEQCQFIDLEAEVSEDEYASPDTESEEEHELETSFVADDSEVFHNTQIQCHYLQSINDHLLNRGNFKIPTLSTSKLEMDVFSQPPNLEDNSYVNDSFCVNTEDADYSVSNTMSELEIAEMLLEERRKNRKKSSEDKVKNRRRIIISDDSD